MNKELILKMLEFNSDKINVGDTIYMKDILDERNLIPVNYRGTYNHKVIIVWKGSQLSIDKNRLFIM